MLRRCIFYGILLFGLFIGVQRVYHIYQPNNEAIIENDKINFNFDNKYTIREFVTYIETTTEDINVIFYNENDINCQYFFNSTLPAIIEENNITSFNNLIYVETSDVSNDSTILTKGRYGFSSTPSLVNLKYSEGEIVVNNSLEENGTTQFDSEAIVKWLKDNSVIK